MGSDRVKLTKCDKVKWGENAIKQVTQFLNGPMFNLVYCHYVTLRESNFL